MSTGKVVAVSDAEFEASVIKNGRHRTFFCLWKIDE